MNNPTCTPRSPKDFKHDLNVLAMDQNASVICGLFYAFGTSKCAGSNSKLIMVNWKECGRKRFWSIFLYYVEI